MSWTLLMEQMLSRDLYEKLYNSPITDQGTKIKNLSQINLNENKLSISFREPFLPRRGRINCSLNDNGKWRWFGTQFTIKSN